MLQKAFSEILFGIVVAAGVSACIDEVSLENAKCPCLREDGYVCGVGNICVKEDSIHTAFKLSKLVGRKYILNVGSRYWVSPSGLGDEIEGVDPSLAFEIKAVDPIKMTFQVLLTTAKDGRQYTCNRTRLLTGKLLDDGERFEFDDTGEEEPVQYYLIVKENEDDDEVTLVSYYNILFSGRFIDEGESFEDGTMEAVLDSREMYKIFRIANVGSGEELCGLASDYLYPCDECPDDPGEAFCMTYRAEGFTISHSPDIEFTEISVQDATCL